MDDRKYTVYKLTSPEGKVYIGCTSLKPEYRWNCGRQYIDNKEMTSDIEMYGWDNFDHEIVASGLNEEDAYHMEQELILRYNSTNRNYGYNKSIGGKARTLGCHYTEETKRKIGDSHRGVHHTEETKRKISESHRGEKHPMYGKHLSEETRRKIGETQRGEKNHMYGKHSPLYGKHHTEETRRKISDYIVKKMGKKVICIETGKIYDSIRAAANVAGCSDANISDALHGRQNTAAGYHWVYAND